MTILLTNTVVVEWLEIYHQLRARRALTQFIDVPLRTRRVLLLYKVYGNGALLNFNCLREIKTQSLNGTSLNSINALLVLSWLYVAGLYLCPTIFPPFLLKPQDSFSEFKNFFLDLQKVQEIIRKHHQIFLQLFWMTYCNAILPSAKLSLCT